MLTPGIWIVSYPRSGNTFVRALLANYLSGLQRPLTLEELATSTFGEHAEHRWRALTGLAAPERSVQQEWAGRARYFQDIRNDLDPARPLLKAHTVNAVFNDIPAYQFVPGDRIVFVVRDPRDVAVSTACFYGVSHEAAVERMLTPGHTVIGHPHHGHEVLGSWVQHTNGWLSEQRAPVHRVRYFDLVSAPAVALTGVLRSLGVDPDPGRVAAAVAWSTFDRLQAAEQAEGFSEAPTHPQRQVFFRVGKPRQWMTSLAPHLAARLCTELAGEMDLLGFDRVPDLRVIEAG